ncbi:UDP-N-acetylmuramoylalanyl-D-glutamate--2,6-diaminopimelate ligase [Orenia metallireducens]|uniref:UDP-N-acetylmuramoylalanyl-D-glutamate--2,6-diaminopimelate ligase n=1 Tax=Orenia metallireducens TaxID=1413210 RepID=A0A285F3V0_9FIRM|nr:UDP-N-acetylmuramoyl-L-alanyl-D-glutamate--2,6-diaminopimelate ligase [Orenia metallireducens]PRX34877.1 UDP-N-acetylmuramoylalanyl-D-glutamate--2,6-diaminopimelate ligase [Orenia metallireducens]SNY05999.1 UDP-N-acetylmuramoylalanyl-D-glutamate--2,6-diaminopimelate ligase [Orenia metallireducens]
MFSNPLVDLNELLLDELIRGLDIIEIDNFQNWEIDHVTDNSKNVKANSLFVAIKGFNVDGHQYINEAISQGAIAIIGEDKIENNKDFTYIRVKNSRKVLAELVNRVYDNPSHKLRIIGVTGTTGKTTTSSMIDHIITDIVGSSGLIGTLYNKIGTEYLYDPTKCTTPDIITLNKFFTKMRKSKTDYLTMEVSSHGLKLDRVWGVDYDVGVFTNLSYDHMEFHKSLEDYYQSKERLFRYLAEDKAAVFNLDDKYTNRLVKITEAKIYTYSIYNKHGDIKAEDIKMNQNGLEFKISINRDIISNLGKMVHPTVLRLRTPLLGYHNIYNILAAFTTALILGFPLLKVKAALESFTGIRRRMEVIYDQDFTIIDDFAHNPASLTANFQTIKSFDYNDLIMVHFLKGRRGLQANRLNAQLIGKWAKRLNLADLITTRAEEEVIYKNKVLLEEEAVFTEIIRNKGINIKNTARLQEAIELALGKTKRNDLLLIIGGPGLDRAAELIREYL